MGTMKYPKVQLGFIEAVLNKLGGIEGAKRFLRGELMVSKPTYVWREQDGVIYFSITSDGTTGPEWIPRLEEEGYVVDGVAKEAICSSDFRPTNMIYEVAVLKSSLFSDRITTRAVRSVASKFQWVTPTGKRVLDEPGLELTCLIREKFTDKEINKMGFRWINIMSKLFQSFDDEWYSLTVSCNDQVLGESNGLQASVEERGGNTWNRDVGFAFVLSQVEPQS